MLRKDITTRMLANGSELTIPVFCFSGTDKKAPSAYIQAGIHGAEVQGCLVAMQLIEHFAQHPPQGDVTIVPFANPYALNIKMGENTFGRFDPMTGDNWNRNYIDWSNFTEDFFKEYSTVAFAQLVFLFKQRLKETISKKLHSEFSYPKKLALQLQQLAVTADVVLDLHCDTFSVPHVYCPSFAMHSVAQFCIPFVIEIPPIFGGALDEAIVCPWAALTNHYNLHYEEKKSPPVEAFTIELGNQETINKKNALEQMQGLLNYFSHKGIIAAQWRTPAITPSIYVCKLENFFTLHATCGGLVLHYAELGQIEKAQQPLVTLMDTQAWSGSEVVSELLQHSTRTLCRDVDSIPLTHAVSGIVHEGTALMKVMTNYKKID